jgi:penicillin-binding protein 1A
MKKIFNPKVAILSIWVCFITFWSGLTLFSYSVAGNWFELYGDIPGFDVLENPKTELATTLYTSNGNVLGYYADVKRSQVRFNEISPTVIQVLVATEDERFEEHSGVDMRSTMRVIRGMGRSGGGSTISQQLAKNLFRMRNDSIYKGPMYSTPLRMFVVKAKEWITAKRLERAYTKKEIITMYLNTVNVGVRAVGIDSGANTYFNKKAS